MSIRLRRLNRGENRLIWAPDMIGCILFLVSGRLGMVALHGEASSWIQSRNLGGILQGFERPGKPAGGPAA